MSYGCPSCNGTTVGRCAHCGIVRFALPRTPEKDKLMSPSQGEELCKRCGRNHGFGGIYYVEPMSREDLVRQTNAKIDAIIEADRRAK